MKNPDRDDEHRRRRSAGDDNEDDLDGREVADFLYGGTSDELPDLEDLSDEDFCELVEQEIRSRHGGMSTSESRRHAQQFRDYLEQILNAA